MEKSFSTLYNQSLKEFPSNIGNATLVYLIKAGYYKLWFSGGLTWVEGYGFNWVFFLNDGWKVQETNLGPGNMDTLEKAQL